MAYTNYLDTVQKVYIAFFQRPADPAGLRYWAERLDAANGDLSEIIEAYTNAQETTDLYGVISEDTIGIIITRIYQGLFGRDPEPEGLAYYTKGFAEGRFTPGSIALDILNGANNEDQQGIANKLAAANLFTETIAGRPLTDPAFGQGNDVATYVGAADAAAARSMLAEVTDDADSVPSPESMSDLIKDSIADPDDPIIMPDPDPTPDPDPDPTPDPTPDPKPDPTPTPTPNPDPTPGPGPGPGPDPDPDPVKFTATTAANSVTFHNSAKDVFTTVLHQSAAKAQYTLDLSQITLEAGSTLHVGEFLFANASNDLSGLDLATALVAALNDPAAENVPPGWVFTTSSGTLTLTATDTGPRSAPEVKYEHGDVAEIQAVNLAGLSLADGQSLVIRDSSNQDNPEAMLYTNNTGDELSGIDLAMAIAAYTPPTGWTLSTEGSRLYFTSDTPGEDQPLLEVARLYDGGTEAIKAECMTRYAWETIDIARQVVAGSGGQTTWQTQLTRIDNPHYNIQTLDFTDLSLAPGETLNITAQKESGNVLLYTNTSSDTLEGSDLLYEVYVHGVMRGVTWDKFDSSSIDDFEETLTFRSSGSNASPLTAHIHASGTPAVYAIDFAGMTVLPNDGLLIDDTSVGAGVASSGADLANLVSGYMKGSSQWTPGYATGSTVVTLTAKIPGPAMPSISSFDMGREAQLDFSGVTLVAGETLHMGDYSYTASTDLGGVALAEALYEDLADKGLHAFSDAVEWTVSHRAGSASLFLVTDNNRTITVTSPVQRYTGIVEESDVMLVSQASPGGGNNPNLSTDFSLSISFGNKILVPGADLRIGNYTFTNTTGTNLSGQTLAEAVLADLLLPANELAVDGVTAWVPTSSPGGATSPWLRLSTDGIKVGYSHPAGEDALAVIEVVQGSGESGGQATPLGLVSVEGGAALVELTSGLSDLDVIRGFKIGEDRIVIPNAEITYLVVDSESLSSADYSGFRYVCGEGLSYSVGANQAGLFALDGEHYLLVNDGTAAFDPDKDIVIKLVGLQGYQADLKVADIFDLSV